MFLKFCGNELSHRPRIDSLTKTDVPIKTEIHYNKQFEEGFKGLVIIWRCLPLRRCNKLDI